MEPRGNSSSTSLVSNLSRLPLVNTLSPGQLSPLFGLSRLDPTKAVESLLVPTAPVRGRSRGPWGPRHPLTPKMRPQHQNSTKLRPQNGSFRPLNNNFFQKFYPLIISIFSRLAMLAIVSCIYVSMHHFILFSLPHISCTL